MANNIIQGEDEAGLEALKNLKEGDKVYTGSYDYDALTGKGEIKVQTFCFRKYVDSKNHTDIQLSESAGIPAILYDEKYPKVDIPQDLSTSFYMSPTSAVLSFRNAMEEILMACDEFLLNKVNF
jgi:hypothetical protein